jgi:hypothetical protein
MACYGIDLLLHVRSENSVKRESHSLLFDYRDRPINAVYFQNNRKHKNKICGQNAQFLNAETGGCNNNPPAKGLSQERQPPPTSNNETQILSAAAAAAAASDLK